MTDQLHYVPISYELCQPVADLIQLCFPDMPIEDQYSYEDLVEMAEIYPQGTVVVFDDGQQVVGMGTGIMTDIDFENLPSTELQLLYDENGVSRHNAAGDYYFGSDLAVHPKYRGKGIARRMYNWRKKEVTDNNKKGFVAAAVLPGYANHWDELTIDDYVAKVVAKKLFDPTLSVQLRNGFQVVKLIHKFFRFPRSKDWSALIYWENPNLKQQ